MTIIGSYEGSNPWNGNMLYRQMMGAEAGGTTLFTGQDTWTDYVGSASWASTTTESISAQKLWSIPLFANTSSLSQAASGADNSYFVQVAKSLLASQSSGSIYVRTGWEFNGGWETWSAGTDPKSYIAAYQQFVDAFRSVSNRFVFTWCPAEATGGMNPASAYPGDAYVDIIGLDVYDNNTYDGANATAAFNAKLNAAYGLNWLASFAAEHNKQIAIPEWGVNSNTDAAFVTLMANWIKTHNVAYASYWDADAGGFNGLLSSMPAVEAAYLSAFGSTTASIAAATTASNTVDASASTPNGTAATAAATTTPAAATQTTSGTTPAAGAPTSGSASIYASVSHEAKFVDLDGDKKSDILFYNSTTHALQAWESTRGLSSAHAVSLGSVTGAWSVAGVGDFDGDGKSDILWMNTTSHDVGLWESSKGFSGSNFVDLGVVTAGWNVAGVGDFDGDGKADILWTNASTHDYGLWESSKGLSASHFVDLGVVQANWSVAGVGDFDGDGKSDILWFNSVTHDVGLWESSKGLSATNFVDLGTVTTGWSVAGVGDFDGDGKSDILWYNSSSHDMGLWESSKGLNAAHFVDLGTLSSGWAPIAVGDYDGDGKADILLQNSSTHDVQLWESSQGLNAAHALDLGVLSSGFSLATTHYSSIL